MTSQIMDFPSEHPDPSAQGMLVFGPTMQLESALVCDDLHLCLLQSTINFIQPLTTVIFLANWMDTKKNETETGRSANAIKENQL